MSKWISVEDDFPELYRDVFVFNGIEVDKDYLDVCSYTGIVYFKNNGDNVTHWMHMPEHP